MKKTVVFFLCVPGLVWADEIQGRYAKFQAQDSLKLVCLHPEHNPGARSLSCNSLTVEFSFSGIEAEKIEILNVTPRPLPKNQFRTEVGNLSKLEILDFSENPMEITLGHESSSTPTGNVLKLRTGDSPKVFSNQIMVRFFKSKKDKNASMSETIPLPVHFEWRY